MNPASLTTPSDSSPLFSHPASANLPAVSAAPVAAASVGIGVGRASSEPVQIYCAGCRHLNKLSDCYACTNCICGLCHECVQAIIEGQSRGRMSMCPRCNAMDSNFRGFQLDLR